MSAHKWLTAAGLVVALTGAAYAQENPSPAYGAQHGGMGVVTALCTKEITAHCANTPRGPETWVCLNTRAKELSETCKTAIDATGPDMGPGTGPVARLCMVEIDKHCAGIEHGRGAVRECLEKHKSELGEPCVVALDNTGWALKR